MCACVGSPKFKIVWCKLNSGSNPNSKENLDGQRYLTAARQKQSSEPVRISDKPEISSCLTSTAWSSSNLAIPFFSSMACCGKTSTEAAHALRN